MRILRRSIARDGSGSVALFPEDSEDMWTAYNLIQPGDIVTATARRKVKTTSDTGTVSSQTVTADFQIQVLEPAFDTQAASLRLSGRIVSENETAEMGSHQTVTLKPNEKFKLEKGDGWDSIALQVLDEACSVNKGSSAWAVVMQEGTANIAVLMGERTVLRQRISVPVPGKKGGEKQHAKGLEKFFSTTLAALQHQIDITQNLPILLASPGFVAAEFRDYVQNVWGQDRDKNLKGQCKNLLVVHSSSGQLHSLSEVLASPEVRARLADTRYAREARIMDDFHALLRADDDRAVYGLKEVERAVDSGAVGRGGGILLMSNALFRSQDVGERKRWVRLHDRVRDQEGGEVFVLSSEHESGKRLEGLGGLAAITTYALPEEEDDEEVEDGGGGVEGGTYLENGGQNGHLAEL